MMGVILNMIDTDPVSPSTDGNIVLRHTDQWGTQSHEKFLWFHLPFWGETRFVHRVIIAVIIHQKTHIIF